MYLSNESLLVIVLVGLVAGFLAGQIVRGAGFGLIGDLLIGIIGAFIGDWLLPQLGLHLGVGIISAIINATIGAVLLLLVIRLGARRQQFRRRFWRGLGTAALVLGTAADSPQSHRLTSPEHISTSRRARAAR